MNVVLEALIILGITSPLFLVGKKQPNWEKQFLLVFIVYFLVDYSLVYFASTWELLSSMELKMNWLGKIISYLIALVFLAVYRKLPLKEYGLTLKQNEDSQKVAIGAILGSILLGVLFAHFFQRHQSGAENILFQLTMPSIVEEITYRGILLGLLNQVFVKSWRIGKLTFGMGVFITSILFGLWHGLSLNADFALSINWIACIYTGLLGLILALVKERTGSLLIPIVMHIIINLLPNVLGYIY